LSKFTIVGDELGESRCDLYVEVKDIQEVPNRLLVKLYSYSGRQKKERINQCGGEGSRKGKGEGEEKETPLLRG